MTDDREPVVVACIYEDKDPENSLGRQYIDTNPQSIHDEIVTPLIDRREWEKERGLLQNLILVVEKNDKELTALRGELEKVGKELISAGNLMAKIDGAYTTLQATHDKLRAGVEERIKWHENSTASQPCIPFVVSLFKELRALLRDGAKDEETS